MKPKLKGLPNPKDLFGVKKVPTFSVVPSTSMIYEGLGMWNGSEKYGPFNWRDHPVQATVYVDALMRHVMAWFAGQDIDPLSNVPHLAHAKACIGILIDAYETGNLIDNRAKNPATIRLLELYDKTNKPENTHATKPRRTTRRASATAACRGPGSPTRSAKSRRR